MTRKQAREAVHTAYNPCVILLNPGDRIYDEKYDALPLGAPLPKGCMVVERWHFGKWRKVDDIEDFLNRNDYQPGAGE